MPYMDTFDHDAEKDGMAACLSIVIFVVVFAIALYSCEPSKPTSEPSDHVVIKTTEV